MGRARCPRCRSYDVRVVDRYCNYSAFNGYHRTPSDYSRVECQDCGTHWRTRAAWVAWTPDRDEAARQARLRAEAGL